MSRWFWRRSLIASLVPCAQAAASSAAALTQITRTRTRPNPHGTAVVIPPYGHWSRLRRRDDQPLSPRSDRRVRGRESSPPPTNFRGEEYDFSRPSREDAHRRVWHQRGTWSRTADTARSRRRSTSRTLASPTRQCNRPGLLIPIYCRQARSLTISTDPMSPTSGTASPSSMRLPGALA